jgi:hypothetical protein
MYLNIGSPVKWTPEPANVGGATQGFDNVADTDAPAEKVRRFLGTEPDGSDPRRQVSLIDQFS